MGGQGGQRRVKELGAIPLAISGPRGLLGLRSAYSLGFLELSFKVIYSFLLI